LLDVAEEEPTAANALLVNDVVIIPDAFPKTRAVLEQQGFRTRQSIYLNCRRPKRA